MKKPSDLYLLFKNIFFKTKVFVVIHIWCVNVLLDHLKVVFYTLYGPVTLFRDSLKNPTTDKIMHSNHFLIRFSKLLCLTFSISDLLKLIAPDVLLLWERKTICRQRSHMVLNIKAPVSKSLLLLLLLSFSFSLLFMSFRLILMLVRYPNSKLRPSTLGLQNVCKQSCSFKQSCLL